MKYLKKFNESISSDIINDCKDILIDLSDDNIKYKFINDPEIIMIEIFSDEKIIDLKKYEDPIKRINDYLESLGFNLSLFSYYKKDGEILELCPICNSSYVKSGPSYSICTDCEYSGDIEEFEREEHYFDKEKLYSYIDNGVKADYIWLNFKKK